MSVLDRYSDRWAPLTETGCYVWLNSVTGRNRPKVRIGGKKFTVARLVCEEANGPPPTPDHEAAHATPNGCIGGLCVNGDHLRWATGKENIQDIPSDMRRAIAQKRNVVKRNERFAAQAAGEIYYFTGKPCLRGHVAQRSVHHGCVICHREQDAVLHRAKRAQMLAENLRSGRPKTGLMQGSGTP